VLWGKYHVRSTERISSYNNNYNIIILLHLDERVLTGC